jgi:hypothetical protein
LANQPQSGDVFRRFAYLPGEDFADSSSDRHIVTLTLSAAAGKKRQSSRSNANIE